MQNVAEYPYKPNIPAFLLIILLFGTGAYYMYHNALANDRGVIIDYIFRFDVQGATIFYWVMAALSAGFVILGAAGLVTSAFSTGLLRLTEDELQLPYGLLRKTHTIPYNQISSLKLMQIK